MECQTISLEITTLTVRITWIGCFLFCFCFYNVVLQYSLPLLRFLITRLSSGGFQISARLGYIQELTHPLLPLKILGYGAVHKG